MNELSKGEKATALSIYLVMAAGLMFLNPLVLMLLWNWFVAPTFEVAYLTYIVAFGLMLIWSFLPKGKPAKGETNPYEHIAYLGTKYILTGVYVVIAIVAKGFI